MSQKHSIPRVSHLTFLKQSKVTIFVYFFFGFENFLKNKLARGSFVVEIDVLRVLHHLFRFVSLTLTPFLISFLIFFFLDKHDFDRFESCNE